MIKAQNIIISRQPIGCQRKKKERKRGVTVDEKLRYQKYLLNKKCNICLRKIGIGNVASYISNICTHFRLRIFCIFYFCLCRLQVDLSFLPCRSERNNLWELHVCRSIIAFAINHLQHMKLALRVLLPKAEFLVLGELDLY